MIEVETMRRPLAWLAALALAFTLSACGGGETTTQNNGEPTPTGTPRENPQDNEDEGNQDDGAGADATD